MNERKFFSKTCDTIDNVIIKNRIHYLLEWYAYKTKRNKKLFTICALVSIIVPLLVSFKLFFYLEEKSLENIILVLLPVLTTLCTSVLLLNKTDEMNLRERQILETIQSEIAIYGVERNTLSETDEINELDHKFIHNIEKIVKNDI